MSSFTHRCWLSISDDDLCAGCAHLAYHPGERSQCQCPGTTHDKDDWPDWPADFDADQYAQSCPCFTPRSGHVPKPEAKPGINSAQEEPGAYYRRELDRLLPVRPVYGASVQFFGCTGWPHETRTLALNKDSIPVIIEWLTKHGAELCAAREEEDAPCPKS